MAAVGRAGRVAIGGCALVAGVSRYDRIPHLPPVSDAEDIAGTLSDPSLCAYPAEQVDILRESAVTRASMLGALDRLAERASAASSVFVYFSGHGGRVPDGPFADCYLMPADATWRTPEDIARTAISGRDLSARLRAIAASRVTIVLDCCRAAGLVEAKDAGATAALDLALSSDTVGRLARGRGRAVLAASSITGSAFTARGGHNSVFTHHLLDGLRGGATGTGGVIRVCDLFHYVQQRVAAELPQQRPIFKAELEENFPVALYRGGQEPAFALPLANDGCAYDAFVSYRAVAPDRPWVERVLVPELERLGLRLCLANRDFRLGAPRIREMERAVEQSRYTVAVLSPRYLDGAFEEFQSLLAQHQGLELKAPRFIPLMREECRPALGIRTVEWLDVTDPDLEGATLQRLALRLREPHRMPLSG
jgi:Caspase domain/TIR domain